MKVALERPNSSCEDDIKMNPKSGMGMCIELNWLKIGSSDWPF
jgi:hypothetical protein